jgi:tRNA threonylcarbamoyladenosine biosynthesis protein TsaB
VFLAIDSSAGASAALIDDGDVVASWSTRQTNTHAEVLAAAVEEVLVEGGLRGAGRDAADGGVLAGVVVGVGPGPFTGLRIGLALAQSLVCVWDVPLYGVCSLDSLAQRAIDAGVVQGEFAVATDARRREVYWASYRGVAAGSAEDSSSAYAQRTDGPHVGPASDVPAGCVVVGQGVSLYPDELLGPDARLETGTWLPEAADLGLIAASALSAGRAGAVLLPPRPLYLRESDAQVPASTQRATTRAQNAAQSGVQSGVQSGAPSGTQT